MIFFDATEFVSSMKPGADTIEAGAIETAAAAWVARRDAGLTPADAQGLQRWLEADPRHRTALEFYDTAWAALAKPSRTGATAEFERHLVALGRRRRRRVAVGGAVLAGIVGLAVVALNLPRETQVASTANATVRTPASQTLADGSVIEFKGNAKVVTDYSATTRRVVLREGEAHFTVQKDSARPFVVSAGGVEVRAVGTAFSVQLGLSSVDVLVTAGRVMVDRTPTQPVQVDTSPSAAPAVAVDAGRRVVVDRTQSSAPAVSIPAPAEWRERLAWRSPRLEFTRTPLAEAVGLLNRHAPAAAARLVIADSTVGAKRISGVFRADNTEAFVLLLEGAFNVRAERVGNTIALHRSDSP